MCMYYKCIICVYDLICVYDYVHSYVYVLIQHCSVNIVQSLICYQHLCLLVGNSVVDFILCLCKSDITHTDVTNVQLVISLLCVTI